MRRDAANTHIKVLALSQFYLFGIISCSEGNEDLLSWLGSLHGDCRRSSPLPSACLSLLRLAQLVTRHPRIQELDLNPFLAAPPGGNAAALDVRIRVG